MKRYSFLLSLGLAAFGQTPSTEEVLALAQKRSAALAAALHSSVKPDEMQKGTAVIAKGGDFLFAVDSKTEPQLFLNDEPGPKMTRLKGATDRWIATTKLATSRT